MSPDAQPWTTRSLLQANGSQSTYYTVTIHPSAANRAAVQGQVARLAAMSPHDLQNLLRAQGVHSHGAPLPPRQSSWVCSRPQTAYGQAGQAQAPGISLHDPEKCVMFLKQAQAACSTILCRAA